MDPQLLTGFFKQTGKIHAPAPRGPGLPKHDPTVKQTVASVLQLPIISVRRSLDNLSCSVVLDLDDPKVSQYCGFFLLGCRESKKLRTCSKLCNANPVFEVISASCTFILPNGDNLCSSFSSCIHSFQALLMLELFSFFLINIFVACLMDKSSPDF